MRCALAIAVVVGCTPVPPGRDAPRGSASAHTVDALASSSAPAVSDSTSATTPATSSAAASTAPSAAASVEAPAEPQLFDDSGAILPQTEATPSADDAIFQAHVASLVRAIATDDAELARPFFFPKAAYAKVKAIQGPDRDWERRLWAHFVRDVHRFHEKVGGDVALDSIEVPAADVTWMKPHREGNAIGYYRVRRAKLKLRGANGRALELLITSMISWRGHWYVVHLDGYD